MRKTMKRVSAALATFAALALLATSPPAAANHHVRAFSAPFIPGAARGGYSNAFIMVTNQQSVSAPLHLKAYVNGNSTAQECDTQPDLRPYEIRRFTRSAGTLCVARDERSDFSVRIRTIEGVQLSGFLVLAADRNRMLIPMEIGSVEPEGPDGITFSRLTVQGLSAGSAYRLSVALRSSSGHWPYPMRACVQLRLADSRQTDTYDNPRFNCGLPNEQLSGWGRPGSSAFLEIYTQDGSHTSAVASRDYYDIARNTTALNPRTYRVCIHRDTGDVVAPPFLCDTVSYSP